MNKLMKCCMILIITLLLNQCQNITDRNEFNDWLENFGGTLKFRVNQYEGNEKLDSYSAELIEQNHCTIHTPGSKWVVTFLAKPVIHRKDAVDIQVLYKLSEGQINQASVSMDIQFDNWSIENYAIMPGAVYDGNRFESRKISYSPKLLDPLDIGPDKPPFINDIPRLNIQNGPSRIQQLTGDMATPAMGFYNKQHAFACWILTKQCTPWGDSGLDIEENLERTSAMFTVTAPGIREEFRYTLCGHDEVPAERGKDFKQGDIVQINVRLFLYPSTSLQGLFERFIEIRKDITGKTMHTCSVPYSACFEVQEKKYNQQNWVNDLGYYSVGMRENFLQDWQMGWTGGMINTYPLLFAGSKMSQNRVMKNFDFIFPDGIAPSGLFWDAGENGKWYGGDIRKPHTKNWHLIRKSGDGVFYIMKQIMLMEKQQQPLSLEWIKGIQTVADALVQLWNTHHQFGQFVDSNTGDVIVGGSTCGGIIPAGLALAGEYFNNKEYLRVAEESAANFEEKYIQKGWTLGGPGDALQAPDSESCYGLLISYVTLFEVTGNRHWLGCAEEVANLFSTWVVSYDFKFPDTSLFGRLGIQSTGAVYANAQNKHAAPGICTYSGVELLKLYRATDNKLYLNLLHDIAHNITQYLSLEDRPIGKMPVGWMGERVNMSDWLEGVGEIVYHSTWAEISNMLTFIEIPGLYIRPDQELLCVFDHVEAEIISSSSKSILVKVFNPTRYDAAVKCLAENTREIKKPLGQNALYNCQVIELKSGESKTLEFNK